MKAFKLNNVMRGLKREMIKFKQKNEDGAKKTTTTIKMTIVMVTMMIMLLLLMMMMMMMTTTMMMMMMTMMKMLTMTLMRSKQLLAPKCVQRPNAPLQEHFSPLPHSNQWQQPSAHHHHRCFHQ